jgi:hypothetical protein
LRLVEVDFFEHRVFFMVAFFVGGFGFFARMVVTIAFDMDVAEKKCPNDDSEEGGEGDAAVYFLILAHFIELIDFPSFENLESLGDY